MGTTQVVVGRVGRAHGVHGEVAVEPRTDEPDRRFAPGAVLGTEAPGERPAGVMSTLTVRTTRWHQGRLLVRFEEIHDRTAAEAARGLLLTLQVDSGSRPEDPEEYYDHQLVGLRVLTTDGEEVGELVAIEHGSAQDLLVVRGPEGREVLVPFVAALVPEIDLDTRRLVVRDRPGLVSPAPGDA